MGLYHFTKFPPIELGSVPNRLILLSISGSLRNSTTVFTHKYNQNLDKESFNPRQVMLNYSNFNLSVRSDQVFLVRFVERAAVGLSDPSQIDNFVLENYKILEILKYQVLDISMFQSTYKQSTDICQLLIYLLLVTLPTGICVFLIYEYKIEKILCSV